MSYQSCRSEAESIDYSKVEPTPETCMPSQIIFWVVMANSLRDGSECGGGGGDSAAGGGARSAEARDPHGCLHRREVLLSTRGSLNSFIHSFIHSLIHS